MLYFWQPAGAYCLNMEIFRMFSSIWQLCWHILFYFIFPLAGIFFVYTAFLDNTIKCDTETNKQTNKQNKVCFREGAHLHHHNNNNFFVFPICSCCCHSNTPIDPSNTTQHNTDGCRLDAFDLTSPSKSDQSVLLLGPTHDWAWLSTSNWLQAKNWLVCASVYKRLARMAP